MFEAYNSVLGKLPNWLRWLLVPVAAFVSYAGITLLLGVIMLGSEQDHLYRPIVIYVAQPFLTTFFSILTVYHTAPRGKSYAALAMGFVWICMGAAVMFFYGFSNEQFWMLVGGIAQISGALGAVIIPKFHPSLLSGGKS